MATYLLDTFKIYKDIWNEKKKSPSLPDNYNAVLSKVNKKYGTDFRFRE